MSNSRFIQDLTTEKFADSFNLLELLKNSVFYPASGTDGDAIRVFASRFESYIHVDYSTSRSTVEDCLRNDFFLLGYNLLGFKRISKDEMASELPIPPMPPLTPHEKSRLDSPMIEGLFYGRDFEPFAFWAVYELDQTRVTSDRGKRTRFSILHIGGEACAAFNALYLRNKINPAALAIIYPGEGYGDNWTIFEDPDFRLSQSIDFNVSLNGALLPRYILSSYASEKIKHCFGTEYLKMSEIEIYREVMNKVVLGLYESGK